MAGSYQQGQEIVSAQGLYVLEAPSGKAVLVNFVGKGDKWLPISQFSKPMEMPDVSSSACIVFIPRWLAEKNDIDYEEYETLDFAEEDHEDEDAYREMAGDPD